MLIGVMVFAACAPTSSNSTPSPSPAASGSLVPTATAASTSSPPQSPAFVIDPSASWPVVLYVGEGGVIRQRTESAVKDIARPCAEIHLLEARPAGLLVSCRAASMDNADVHLISVADGKVTRVASDVVASWPADISPDGRTVAAFRLGDCPMPAPVCQTRAVLIDIVGKTEREILPSGYHLGARLEWTALGLTLFQPECAEAGLRRPWGQERDVRLGRVRVQEMERPSFRSEVRRLDATRATALVLGSLRSAGRHRPRPAGRPHPLCWSRARDL